VTDEITDDQPIRGGLEAWAPSITPPIGVDLSDEQKLACAFRILAKEGVAENLAGHITWQRPGDDTMLVNPWGLWWREVSASDICTVDEDARIVSGKWDVTPAIHIHTELHRRRSDARVVVHNHPYHVCLIAALGVLPELVHQTGAMFLDDMVFIREYTGEIDSGRAGAVLAEQIGDASLIILGSHGLIVTGATIEEATYRAASIDRVCKLAYDILAVQGNPLEMDRRHMLGMKKSLIERAADVYFAGATRLLLRDEPDVLK
jgi:ribulose-5-phosphate 4-epimerase/fuculose-1-phosphate aldolase